MKQKEIDRILKAGGKLVSSWSMLTNDIYQLFTKNNRCNYILTEQEFICALDRHSDKLIRKIIFNSGIYNVYRLKLKP